ncbi:hypothetical protein BABINDRAFT_160967 [Babjeviella inositovora NRRL Y-12698]|uniref:Uncharacterized protein n=1 Tax=Babjeviella inositovora NRRL Y-12698 TaxID=984486 RepID=A0A1E3QSV6_9ASCO|nr:uncharacterized protein BABINDRAFT_160967 [Babjeviella inositovora NRRL Y-12698]ODQ80750.1 hypothetical protein BABINDRAFT_160967 [Babjeviella inositovora NRRL Y-12698]
MVNTTSALSVYKIILGKVQFRLSAPQGKKVYPLANLISNIYQVFWDSAYQP